MGGKNVLLWQSPATEQRDGHNRHNRDEELGIELGSPVLDDGNPSEHTVHGHPITISQCTFQAHVARACTEAEVRAVSDAVSATTEHEAGFSHFVGPFAYRLACVGHGRERSPRNLDDGSRGPEDDSSSDDSEEGFCDNGDVGSGEKLLHLLQKWDVRNRVLMVTRIDGGFMMAELMGIRRYKFVVDRAKKLLENTDLASLRRAVDADILPPTTAEANVNLLAAHEQAVGGRQGGVGGGVGGPAEAGSWDRFVVPISARRKMSGHTAQGHSLGAPRASGGALIPPPCDGSSLGAAGNGGGGGRGARIGAKNAISSSNNAGCAAGAAAAAGSTRTRARRVLSLAHLSISAKTVPFPRGHVPSVMGAKGHGKKRGRINHFAVRTPPDDTGACGRYVGDGIDPFDNAPPSAVNSSSPSADDDAQGGRAATSGWSLPHELDPTSSTTAPGKAATREGSGSTNNCSGHTASRVSTCDTINSPGRVAAIMLGVTGVHTALPPPYTNASDGGGPPISGGLYRLEIASSSPGVGADGSSFTEPQLRPHPILPGTTSSAPGGPFAKSDDTSWVGGVFQHQPGGGGGGMAALEGPGCSSSSSPAAWAAGHGGVLSFSGVDGCVFPPTGGVRGVAEGNAAALPLLRRAPGSGVRDEPPPSLVIVPGDGGGITGGGGAIAAPLSNASTVGRWRSDGDDDGASTISSTAGGGKVRAKHGAETMPPAGSNHPEPSPIGFALEKCLPDEPDGRAAAAAAAAAAFPVETRAESPAGGAARRKECDTPATWGSDDLSDLRGVASARSDPPPTRGKSGLRGWTVGRAAPACSPLLTQKRGGQSATTGR